MSQHDEHWMRAAIEIGRGNPAAPFGAVIVDTDANELLASGINNSQRDALLHGEVCALQELARLYPDHADRQLTLYTTAEPCPMCAAACVWARMDEVVYGAPIPYLAERGYRQIHLRCADIFAASDAAPLLRGPVLETECAALFPSRLT